MYIYMYIHFSLQELHALGLPSVLDRQSRQLDTPRMLNAVHRLMQLHRSNQGALEELRNRCFFLRPVFTAGLFFVSKDQKRRCCTTLLFNKKPFSFYITSNFHWFFWQAPLHSSVQGRTLYCRGLISLGRKWMRERKVALSFVCIYTDSNLLGRGGRKECKIQWALNINVFAKKERGKGMTVSFALFCIYTDKKMWEL